MSDNSTGSSGSSSNSWTLLSAEEAAIDPAGPVDDGTESIGDAPSLSEDVAGSSEVKSSEGEVPLENIFSQEGHQVCQETSPEYFEGTAFGITAVEADPEICAPVIHDTITSSPPDNDLLGAVPFSIATESSLFLPEEPVLEQETFLDIQPTYKLFSKDSPALEPIAEVTTPLQQTEINSSENPNFLIPDVPGNTGPIFDSCTSATPGVDIHVGASSAPESSSTSQLTEADFGSRAEKPLIMSQYPETVTSSVSEKKEPTIQKEIDDLADKLVDVEKEPDFSTNYPGVDDGLRLRHVQHTELQKESSDEEEEKFKMPERKEKKSSFSLNHLILGALALLCLGSLFFSDFDGSELSDQELLEKLAQENKQISVLEAQIQSQKEELDKALRIAADKGATDQENDKMKEELSTLPALKEELEALKARINELTQLTGQEATETSSSSVPSSPGGLSDSQGTTGSEHWWDKQHELKRQKTLLEESRKRLEGIKKQGWHKKDLRDSLVEMQKRLSQQVEQLGKRDEWKRKHKEGRKEWGEKKSNQLNLEEVHMEHKMEWKLSKDKSADSSKYKEHFKKYREEWGRKKDDRKLERERRKQDKPWHIKPDLHQQHYHQKENHQQLVGFWKHQEEKLRRNQNHPEHCRGLEECADAEGLIPVKLLDFQALLEIYLDKLKGVSDENLEAFRHLVARFFCGDSFCHDHMLFSEFVEDVADILEDLADVEDKQQGVDSDTLEEEMEQFEREALWKFAAPSV